jgi:signal transduction histidine kinase
MVWDTRLKAVPARQNPLSVECTVAAARDPLSGSVLELRWRLHDNTDRKNAEAAVRESREALRQLSGRLEAVREEERERIARAVHDEIGAALTAIKMDIAHVRTGLERLANGQHAETRELQDRTQATSELIDDTMQKVRSIAIELRPAILDDFGLVAALDMLLNDFQKRSGLECSLNVAPGPAKLDKRIATAVFRVFQEILTNVARHANATKVEVRLSQSGDELVLDVRDNGRGLQPEDIQRPDSLGLLGMRERMRSVGGTVEVSNRPGGGTHVCVKIPLPNPAASSSE